MQRRAELFEAPKDILFSLRDITYSPEAPRMKVPFTVKGKIELIKIPFLAPIWVMVKITYPERWWEEIIPIIGSPTVTETDMVVGGNFEITFPRGFDREGEFLLEVEVYSGPTMAVDKMTLPPFPPVTKEETTFMVSGEVPPEEAGFRNFRILSYSKNGGEPVTPPGVLELDIGDRCRVNVGFDHRDGAVTGKFHAAIWQDRPWDPHDEILNAEKTFSAPSSTDWEPIEDSIDIPITSAISPGTEYGLYVKIMGITGGDIFTEYLENVITIVGVPPEEADIKDFDFKLTKGSYDIGATVPFTAPYDYKGIAQGGRLTISIGTGIYPTFSPVYTYEPIPVEFPAAGDWEHRGLEGNITLPDVLEYGQTYSVRAKLETLEVPTQETDTDWSAFDITEMELLEVKIDPAGAGHVTVSPEPAGGTEHNWYFPHGTVVYVTAHPNPGYIFKSWSGEMTDTTAITAPVYPMTEKRTITAHFESEVVPPPTSDIRNFDFRAEAGTYDLGDSVPFDAPYEYKGKAQSGWLTVSLGTGVYPSFFTKHTFPRTRVTFDEAMDWTSGRLTGSFTLPTTLEAGQTYNTRAKLETDDGKQETDTDWGVITIREVPTPPKADIKDFDFRATGGTYDIGDKVPFTAPYDYKGKAQSGRLTISLGTGVYPSFFTKYTFSPISVSFNEAMDWQGGVINGQFTLPSTLEPGQTYSVRAKLEAISDYTQETDTDWGVIIIREAPPVYKGTISKKQLEYDGTRRSIPVSSVPYDKRGLVHIWGRNDTGTTQDLGIHWLVYDPDGVLVEDYSDWSYGHGAGKDHEFIGGRFDLDKAGTYRINIALSMNPSAPEIVDTYYGTLCTVEAPPVEKYDLTTEVYPSGTGYISPSSGTYDAGTKVTITAYSYSGWDFNYWGGDASGILSSTTITMDSDKHAIAYFRYKGPY